MLGCLWDFRGILCFSFAGAFLGLNNPEVNSLWRQLGSLNANLAAIVNFIWEFALYGLLEAFDQLLIRFPLCFSARDVLLSGSLNCLSFGLSSNVGAFVGRSYIYTIYGFFCGSCVSSHSGKGALLEISGVVWARSIHLNVSDRR